MASRRTLPERLGRRPLTPFLLAATVALDLVLVVLGLNAETDDRTVYTGPLVAQVGLLAVWASSRRRGALVRFTLAAVGVVALTVLTIALHEGDFVALYGTWLGADFALAFLGCVAVRWVLGSGSRRRRMAPPRQFSIAGVLVVTTLTAVGASLASRNVFGIVLGDLELLSVIATEAAMPPLCLALALRLRNPLVALLAMVGMIAVLVLGCGLVISAPTNGWRVPLLYFAGQTVFLAAWLLGVRERGRRVLDFDEAQPAGPEQKGGGDSLAEPPPPDQTGDASPRVLKMHINVVG
ncbi:hypothetical protein Mal64_13750 [Pseudobythopirellula maris]|uniref:Uncharacterized protein n=1 Tax=Pseudobythopirellula maris TaxID=2527991 RepID=A0A5C5ZUS5_9BACT|nr:hypothetical protein [Pseudobythopirellula maris]TWT90976.1 hypothetical protein Mal64_13750 [Pseudobythopirellula maris]